MNATMRRLLLLVIIIVSVVYGYLHELDGEGEEQVFTTSYDSVEFIFPEGWFKNPKEHPYDLQCFSKDERMTTGVFQFARIDFSEDFDPKELLTLQVDDMKSLRKNFKPVEINQPVRGDNKTLTTVMYSGEKGISKYYYRFTYIQFDENPDIHLVVLQVALPSNWLDDEPILDKITRSARIKPMAD